MRLWHYWLCTACNTNNHDSKWDVCCKACGEPRYTSDCKSCFNLKHRVDKFRRAIRDATGADEDASDDEIIQVVTCRPMLPAHMNVDPGSLTRKSPRTSVILVEDMFQHCFEFNRPDHVHGSARIAVEGSFDATNWYIIQSLRIIPGTVIVRGLHRHVRVEILGWSAPYTAPQSWFPISVRYTGDGYVKQ